MKIVVGLGRLEDLEAYARCGADEVFCGYAPAQWLEKYGMRLPVNRRESLLSPVNIGSRSDMRLLAQRAQMAGVDVSVTCNSLSYVPEQYDLLTEMIRDLADMGICRCIVADPALLLRLRNMAGIRLHASGELGAYDRDGMALLREWGVERYIFHRKMRISEMAACVKDGPGAEYEAFVLNERCYYTGAMCHCLHGDIVGPLCRVPWKIGGVAEKKDMPCREMDAGGAEDLGGSGCGLCALPDLARAGITHLKIVGRGNHARWMKRDIRAVKRAIEIMQEGENGYEERMQAELFSQGCPGRCYYPGNKKCE